MRYILYLLLLLFVQPAEAQLFRRSSTPWNATNYYNGPLEYGKWCRNPNCKMCNHIEAVNRGKKKEPKVSIELALDPTPQEAMEKLFTHLNLNKYDVFFDLGCGDGRVVREAAKSGAKSIGIELNKASASLAYDKSVGIHNVAIVEGNILDVNLSNATTIYMYLYPPLMQKVFKNINEQCSRGTRVVSYSHEILGAEKLNIGGCEFYIWTLH